MSINPQAATEIAHGAGRVRSFIENIQPGQGRRMPMVAGSQREGNTPMNALPVIAGSSPIMPRTQMPTMPQAQAAGVSLNGMGQPCLGCNSGKLGFLGLQGLRGGWSTWPTWLKVLLPVVIIGGGSVLAWSLAKRAKRVDEWPSPY